MIDQVDIGPMIVKFHAITITENPELIFDDYVRL